ncbi:hypothetical protein GKZ68_18090 [Hymenobacter sp. BRD128]|uniref:hypothetical protein n=1 Tax=Hymenobacter sp. BRD128 TaxID=2675878 RepID=UPI001563D412|nr:hypothetical protein [Hymenobacter sp. BRD128]QKG58371.1 hypothetical protein GKZ68_18090 [Hymenobacter sp. BRD128]
MPDTLTQAMRWAFWYCCDFMVNLGNRTHSSYYEANTWVLLVLLPGLLALLIGVRVGQRLALRRVRRRVAARR